MSSRPRRWLRLALVVAAGGACGEEGAGSDRGQVVSEASLGDLDRAAVDGLRAMVGESERLGPATHDVALTKLAYRTIDVDGGGAVASALLAVPNLADGPLLGLVVYLHGTTTKRESVPSRRTLEGVAVAALFAANGYVVVAPDGLGLGDHAGFHPYLHAASEATSAVDALAASRAALVTKGVAVPTKLFVTGYSQGGHWALATHRELERSGGQGDAVTATVAGSGPYSLSRISVTSFLTTPGPSSAGYSSYLVTAYDRIYDVYGTTTDAFRPPYDAQIEPLFDGTRDLGTVVAMLPPTPAELFQPTYAALALQPASPLGGRLAENDVDDWSPRAPITLCASNADPEVPPANAITTAATLNQRGGTVTLVELAGLGHTAAFLPCMIAAKQAFDAR